MCILLCLTKGKYFPTFFNVTSFLSSFFNWEGHGQLRVYHSHHVTPFLPSLLSWEGHGQLRVSHSQNSLMPPLSYLASLVDKGIAGIWTPDSLFPRQTLFKIQTDSSFTFSKMNFRFWESDFGPVVKLGSQREWNMRHLKKGNFLSLPNIVQYRTHISSFFCKCDMEQKIGGRERRNENLSFFLFLFFRTCSNCRFQIIGSQLRIHFFFKVKRLN